MERELLKAGKLDTYITVYQLTRTQDSYGGYSKSRSSLKSLWAMVVPYKGKEKVEDETIVSTNKVGFLVRWDDDLNLDSSTVSPEQKYQVQYLSKYYEIDSVEYNGRGMGILINCSFKDDGRLA
tara:strand:+ start:387 stop:758 length:372 start_codon:yes stop_codon:yes gene_type:complete